MKVIGKCYIHTCDIYPYIPTDFLCQLYMLNICCMTLHWYSYICYIYTYYILYGILLVLHDTIELGLPCMLKLRWHALLYTILTCIHTYYILYWPSYILLWGIFGALGNQKSSFNHVKNWGVYAPYITYVYTYYMLYGLAIGLTYKYYRNGPQNRVENWANYI